MTSNIDELKNLINEYIEVNHNMQSDYIGFNSIEEAEMLRHTLELDIKKHPDGKSLLKLAQDYINDEIDLIRLQKL